MTILILTQGLPASGKTTWARLQEGFWRINRDDLRAMALPTWPHGDRAYEDALTFVQHAAISSLLRQGVSVICDDTNLNSVFVSGMYYLARECGAEVRVKDFTHVTPEECIKRDALRVNPVGKKVIMKMYNRYLKRFE